MSWIQKLYETYENCQSMIGTNTDGKEVPLLPICHTTQKAQIEIVIDQDGNFKRARVVPKDDARTIIPCTESSGGRTSGVTPHPLCDKLQYVAADYTKYGGDKKQCFSLNSSAYDKNDVESEYFKEECLNTRHRLINDIISAYKKLKSFEVLNELIKIPNMIELLNKNIGLSNVQKGIIDAATVTANKYKLIEIFPLTLEKTITYEYLLQKWCDSEFEHAKAKAILKYVRKKNVISDLVNYKVLIVGEDGRLMKKWNGDNKAKPEIFTLFQNEQWQADAFVRWIVEIPGDLQSFVWADPSLFESWIKYYSSTKESYTLCYVTGTEAPAADQHPAKIRNDGDKAKLISSNDTSGFTFRGRFLNAGQACGVGFEVTQKAHNALRWLISKQGYRRGEQAIVTWSIKGKEIPDPLADPFMVMGYDSIHSDSEIPISTAQELAQKLNAKISGYSVNMDDNFSDIVVMGMDSATPGRMAITFYRELTGSDFLKRINKWHETCSWIHDYRIKEVIDSKTGKKKKIHIRFAGAPSPGDITVAAYGERVDDKLRKSTIERILPCIIDRQRIPRDLVESTVRRACNRIGMEEWEWNKTLSIACALYREYQKDYLKEDLDMALDEHRKTREYLYGRLLALADNLEKWALRSSGEDRQTTAARLMQRFSEHPFSTWRTIEMALQPYKARLGNKASKMQNLISEVTSMFETDDFINDKKLSGEFLLGYHCQREALQHKEQEE